MVTGGPILSPPARSFLHRYGREANQGEVALLLENADGQWFYRVRAPYDAAGMGP